MYTGRRAAAGRLGHLSAPVIRVRPFSPAAQPPLTSALFVVALLAAGCSPKIGDECSTALDCSALGDRLCDITQPGGYCTQFGCQADGCPEEAACIVFHSEIDPACSDVSAGKFGRFSQTFCMRTCEASSDCRGGYACLRPADRSAVLLDKKKDDPANVRICVAIATVAETPDVAPGICSPGNAGPFVPSTASAGAGAGGAGGAGGQGAGGN